MNSLCELIGLVIITFGMTFNLIGCLGLVRLPDAYNRMQAATKCVTLGTSSVLLGACILSGFSADTLKLLLTMFFILLTAPTAAHAIARGTHIYGVPLWEKSVVDRYEAEVDNKLHRWSAGKEQ
jgi:multicomponent Na+:H+ antiporter subunit G